MTAAAPKVDNGCSGEEVCDECHFDGRQTSEDDMANSAHGAEGNELRKTHNAKENEP
jgi:hypothetical protein